MRRVTYLDDTLMTLRGHWYGTEPNDRCLEAFHVIVAASHLGSGALILMFIILFIMVVVVVVMDHTVTADTQYFSEGTARVVILALRPLMDHSCTSKKSPPPHDRIYNGSNVQIVINGLSGT